METGAISQGVVEPWVDVVVVISIVVVVVGSVVLVA